MKTSCCNYEINNENPPVKWNEFNGVVQCHNCGHVYVPKYKLNLQAITIQLLAARMSNATLLKGRKNVNPLSDAERYEQGKERARRALIDAKCLREVLEAEMPF